jgi:CBS domain-containing protein
LAGAAIRVEIALMNIGNLCSRRLVTVSVGAPVSEVARLMRDEHVGAVVVTRDGGAHPTVAGIITDRDIVRAQLARTADLTSLSAEEAMTRDPLAFSEDETIDRAIAHLRARGVRRAPVVKEDGTPVGVISVDDLLAHLATKLIGLAGIVAQQVRKEAD